MTLYYTLYLIHLKVVAHLNYCQIKSSANREQRTLINLQYSGCGFGKNMIIDNTVKLIKIEYVSCAAQI